MVSFCALLEGSILLVPMPHQSAVRGARFQHPRVAESNIPSCLRNELGYGTAGGQRLTVLLKMFGEM